MKYTVVLVSEPDGGYVATVPVLPGCISQGDNRAEALANIREAMELYLEDCRLSGDPIPVEASVESIEVLAGSR
jgi:predicted RNase H-like HicB family nuclease